MDKISIIVPIYNGARFLDRIVPALLDQTYQNTEIILVNDGSTDDTAAVCAAYAEKYPAGISFVDAPHGGVSCARNHGLDHASGDWIYFCDADDRPEPEICEYLLQLAKEHDARLSCCALICDNSAHTDIRINLPCSGIEVWEREKIIRPGLLAFLKLIPLRVSGLLHTCLLNMEVIRKHHLRFTPGVVFLEDVLFFQEYLRHIDRLVISDRVLYHYLVTESSASHNFFNNPKISLYVKEMTWSHMATNHLEIFRSLGLGEEFPVEEERMFVNALYHRMQLTLHDPLLKWGEKYRRLAGHRREAMHDPLFRRLRAGQLERIRRIFLRCVKLGIWPSILFCAIAALKKSSDRGPGQPTAKGGARADG